MQMHLYNYIIFLALMADLLIINIRAAHRNEAGYSAVIFSMFAAFLIAILLYDPLSGNVISTEPFNVTCMAIWFSLASVIFTLVPWNGPTLTYRAFKQELVLPQYVVVNTVSSIALLFAWVFCLYCAGGVV